MKDLGWVPGQNVVAERRYGESADQLRAAAADLVSLKVDVLVTPNASLARILQRETKTIPIVVQLAGGELVVGGLVASLARPGGNLTGVQVRNDELIPKKLEVLKALVPTLSRLAFLRDDVISASSERMVTLYDQEAAAAARSLG
jgi:putative ABC transport system substrate-binding protein